MPKRHLRQKLEQNLPWAKPQPHDASEAQMLPAERSPEDIDREQTRYLRLFNLVGGAALVTAGVAVTLSVQTFANRLGAYPTPPDISPLYYVLYRLHDIVGALNHVDMAVGTVVVASAAGTAYHAGQAAHQTLTERTTARHSREVEATAQPVLLPASTSSEDLFADMMPLTSYPEEQPLNPHTNGYGPQSSPPAYP